MNFNYGYNVKAAQPLQAKQVEKVKEEVVEKKEAEVKAEGPKYEVITGAANILADINKATVKGAGEVGDPRDDEITINYANFITLDIDSYNAAVNEYNANANNWDDFTKLSKLTAIEQRCFAVMTNYQFNTLSVEQQTEYFNACVSWNNERDEVMVSITEQVKANPNDQGKVETFLNAVAKYGNSLGSLKKMSLLLPNAQDALAPIVNNYCNRVEILSVLNGIRNNTELPEGMHTRAYQLANVEKRAINTTLPERIQKTFQRAHSQMDGLSLYQKLDKWNSISDSVMQIMQDPRFENTLNDDVKEMFKNEYKTLNQERDTFIATKADEVREFLENYSGGNPPISKLTIYMNAFSKINDSSTDYNTVLSKFTKEQSINFFNSKISSIQSVLDALNQMKVSYPQPEAQTIIQQQVDKFTEMLANARKCLAKARNSVNISSVNKEASNTQSAR